MEYIEPMLSLLRRLLGRLLPQPLDPHIEQRVARAIEQIDPRLKAFGNYPRAYIPAIIAASRYVKELTATLPECIDLSPALYARQPLLPALFSDVEGSIIRCARVARLRLTVVIRAGPRAVSCSP